jgi:hypothetical protein
VSPSPFEQQPPQWAQTLLRALLEVRDRDMIAGDLLEEYRERTLSGVRQARSWYVWQVLSFARLRLAPCGMVFRIARLWFLAFAALALGTLRPDAFTPAPGVILFLLCVPGAAVQAAARMSSWGLGVAAAVTTASLIALLTAATVSILHLPHPPLGTLPSLPGIAAIVGGVGALFGLEFGGRSPLTLLAIDRAKSV